MAYTITSESYGPRKPFITATATSTDDLAVLGTDFAEGSTCIISTTTYKLDKVKGWIDPSQGGGGGGGSDSGVLVVNITNPHAHPSISQINHRITDKTAGEIKSALESGIVITRSDGITTIQDDNDNEYTVTLTRTFNKGNYMYGELSLDSGICFVEDDGVYKLIYSFSGSPGPVVLTASSLDDYLLFGTTD